MSKKMQFPNVVLAGRTNVGKSTLFNRLVRNSRSMVFDRPGVTRDYLADVVSVDDKAFKLVDTGGIPLKATDDPFAQAIRKSVDTMLAQASLILFMCDVKVGVQDEDLLIAKILHKSGRPVVLLLNKVDNDAVYQEFHHEFLRLGFNNILPISSLHGTGISDLLTYIAENIEMPTDTEEAPAYAVTLLGRPNVGKSSLMNLLIGYERTMVSDIPGTTREAISERLTFHKETIQLVDTAGVRRKRKVDDELEQLMVKSSLYSLRDADIILLVIDASEKRIADQELKLLFYALEQHKCVIIIWNKIDLLDDLDKEELEHDLEQYEFVLKKVPQIRISCLEKKNIGKILKAVQEVHARCVQEVNSTQLDEAVKMRLYARPMYSQNKLLKVFKIRHAPARIPTFVVHVENPTLFNQSHLGYLENIIRDTLDLVGCPIQLLLRKV